LEEVSLTGELEFEDTTSYQQQADSNGDLIQDKMSTEENEEGGEPQEEDIQDQDMESKMAEATSENKTVNPKKPKKSKQPSAEIRVHGEHFAYNSKMKGRCRLTGCKRITTNCCTNPLCNMHLCGVESFVDYFDAGQRLTPPSKQEVLDNLKSGMRNCFLIYHCMTKPTVLLKQSETI
jgi:hypothetical protein